jgi:hypothetical protein
VSYGKLERMTAKQRNPSARASVRLEHGGGISRSPGVISSLEVYTIEEAKVRLGWSDSALRAAKRKGLRLLACGKRRYVSGKEVIRFLENMAAELPP